MREDRLVDLYELLGITEKQIYALHRKSLSAIVEFEKSVRLIEDNILKFYGKGFRYIPKWTRDHYKSLVHNHLRGVLLENKDQP